MSNARARRERATAFMRWWPGVCLRPAITLIGPIAGWLAHDELHMPAGACSSAKAAPQASQMAGIHPLADVVSSHHRQL